MKFSDSRRGHSDQISCLAFSPDGKYFASGSFDKSTRLWRIDNSAPITPYGDHNHTISLLAFSPDGQYLAASSWDGTVQIWDKGRGGWEEDDEDDEDADLLDMMLEGHDGPVNGVLWVGEWGKVVTCGDDCTVRLWYAPHEEELKQMSVKQRPLHFCRFPHPDPIVLVVCDGSWCKKKACGMLGNFTIAPSCVCRYGKFCSSAGLKHNSLI